MEQSSFTRRRWLATALTSAAAINLRPTRLAAQSTKSIKIGFSESLTGGLAGSGKQALLTKQIWRDEVNAAGGLLGRKIELVYYDDQSSPSQAPGIYTKLLDVDKVDVVLGNGTNVTAAVMSGVIQRNKLILTPFALAVNATFKYPRYFQTMPYGPNGKEQFGAGFFGAAMTLDPKPQSTALVGADAEFAINALEGARTVAKRLGLRVVYDRTYPPNMIEFGTVIRAIQATNPDLVFVASYPPDSSGILRAALESRLRTRLFGGGMVGLQYAALKQHFGEGLNGVVSYELFVRAPTLDLPGIPEFVARYRARAGEADVDQLGHYVPPSMFSTMQILEQAIRDTGSIEDDTLTDYMRNSTFKTVMGNIKFGPDGEWTEGRILMTQYQNVRGRGLDQFDRAGTQVIVWPPQHRSGTVRAPFPPEKN